MLILFDPTLIWKMSALAIDGVNFVRHPTNRKGKQITAVKHDITYEKNKFKTCSDKRTIGVAHFTRFNFEPYIMYH